MLKTRNRFWLGLVLAGWAWGIGGAWGAERAFDFSGVEAGGLPAGFRSALTGEGEEGDWRVEEVPLQGVGQSSVSVRELVVVQGSRDATDERFPLLVYDDEVYTDFVASVKVRAVSGGVERMGGLAFRLTDSTNYYVLRLSALGNTVRFYKVVDGVRSAPIGVSGPVSAGEWHELKVSCQGNQIRCWYDGQELFPPLSDNSFTKGKLAFWTKSDSVTHFKDLRVDYVPSEILAKRLVREAMERSRRLVSLDIYAVPPGVGELRLVATSEAEGGEGKEPGKIERDVAENGKLYYGKEDGVVSVVAPIRDRNGDPVAAVRIRMEAFAGQTQNNALARVQPIVERFSSQVREAEDLFR
ncbi:MAG: hypothetical protein ACO34E_10945 [Limisphaerales bacterium]|jgi:hypothetical protein